jgi:hypothetical protein
MKFEISTLSFMCLQLNPWDMKFFYDVFMFEILNLKFKVAYDLKSKSKKLGFVCLWYEI